MNALLSNPFKEGLRKGDTQIGLWLSSTTSYMAEIAATSGYDWLLIDGEHAPNTVQDLYHQLQAIAPYASQPVIRPIEGSKALIKQVLDIGAQTLLIPMVDTAEQARQVVSATRYPPLGQRGVGASVARAARWGESTTIWHRPMSRSACWCRLKAKWRWKTLTRFWRLKALMASLSVRQISLLHWVTPIMPDTRKCSGSLKRVFIVFAPPEKRRVFGGRSGNGAEMSGVGREFCRGRGRYDALHRGAGQQVGDV